MNYLDNYVDTIESIPLELGRNLSLLLELEGQTDKLIDEINQKYTEIKQCTSEQLHAHHRALDALLESVVEKAEQKVSIASRAYEYVDKQVRRLDDDLIRFDADFQLSEAEFEQLKKRISSQSSTQQQNSSSNDNQKQSGKQQSTLNDNGNGNTNGGRRNGRPPRKAADKTLKKIGQANAASSADNSMDTEFDPAIQDTEHNSSLAAQIASKITTFNPRKDSFSYAQSNDGIPNSERATEFQTLPSFEDSQLGKNNDIFTFPSSDSFSHALSSVDPNEPKYCYCNQVSYGEMVACDNKNCEIEWFHYDCVGLKMPPKGKWYCNECIQKKRKGLIK